MSQEFVDVGGVELVKPHLEELVERFKEEVEQGSSQGVRVGDITIVDDGDDDDRVMVLTNHNGLVSDGPISEYEAKGEYGTIYEHYDGVGDSTHVEEASVSIEGDYLVFISASTAPWNNINVTDLDGLSPDGFVLNHLGVLEDYKTEIDGYEADEFTYYLVIEEVEE